MRLIDADKIRYSDMSDGQVPGGLWYTFKETIDKTPTVKAITIEWLHSIMKKQLIFAMESEMEGKITVEDGLIHCVSGALACQVLANVIKLWEKENEAN